ncbi:MAG: hypothetical protein Q8O34_17910 [Rhodocyclaceae bacterium]|nr:hypothetical protein [Rhodocyclaceae bacterium]
MNEYILFDAILCERFMKFIADHGLEGEMRPDPIEGFVVALPDDLADDIEEAVEDEYAALMAEQVRLMESAGNSDARTLMRVIATLADGSERTVQFPAVHARRLFEHFTAEEIHELVSVIVQSAMTPVEGPMCRKASSPQSPPEADPCATTGETQ